MSQGNRVAVLGSDLDGIVAALALAERGVEAVLIEESAALGGLAAAVEIAPGYRAPLALDRGRLRGDLLRRLEIASEHLAPPAPVLHAGADGRLVAVDDDPRAATWLREVTGLAGWARRITHRPAPPLDPRQDWRAALAAGVATRFLGKQRIRRLVRIGSLPIADWLGESMEDGPLAAALAATALESTPLGPVAAGTGLNAVLRAGLIGARADQGLPALLGSLERALADAGVVIRRGEGIQGVHSVGEVWVIHLDSNEAIEVDGVVSSLPPQRLLLDLLHNARLPVEMLESLRSLRCRGDIGVVLLAVEGAPWANTEPGSRVLAHWTSLEALEVAADGFKNDHLVEQPPIELTLPSQVDSSLAPEGASVVTAHVHNCPAEADSEQLIAVVSNSLSLLGAEARGRIVAAHAWTPADLKRDYGLPGGHLEHAEWALDQLLVLRPDASYRGGATPLPGLSICGPGCHPGVGLHGASGWWAAKHV